ncbi:MAG: hypothetical protein H7Z42_08810 [Roseiflexaceae bacterium]|nr:hypothetical protein [Roseiflexaceae bacterium]
MDEHTPQPATYRLIVAGHLDPAWSNWFDGSEIVQLPDGTTSLTGDVSDQSALYGLLARARDLGLTLLSLQRIGG